MTRGHQDGMSGFRICYFVSGFESSIRTTRVRLILLYCCLWLLSGLVAFLTSCGPCCYGRRLEPIILVKRILQQSRLRQCRVGLAVPCPSRRLWTLLCIASVKLWIASSTFLSVVDSALSVLRPMGRRRQQCCERDTVRTRCSRSRETEAEFKSTSDMCPGRCLPP